MREQSMTLMKIVPGGTDYPFGRFDGRSVKNPFHLSDLGWHELADVNRFASKLSHDLYPVFFFIHAP